MANVSRTIDIIFNGTDNVSGATKSIVKGIKQIDQAADFTVDKLNTLADGFKTAELAALALGTTLATLATMQFKKFESAWIDLDKIINPTTDDLEVADAQVQALALHYGVSVTEITRSTIDFKRAGFDLADSLTLVEGSLQLASAGNVEMATSTEFMIAIMKGFELELSDTGEVINTLNVLSDKYATTVEELGIALSRVAPTAKTAGLTMREAASLAVPIIEVFRSGEEAGTALRRGLIKLTDDAKPVQNALAMLGVEQRAANGELRSGKDILYDIAAAFGKANDSNKLFIASQLFGQRQAAKMIKVLDDWNYVMSIQSVEALNDFSYTLEQVDKKLASTEVGIGRTLSALELISIRIGQKVKPGIDSTLSGITTLLTEVSNAIQEGLADTLLNILNDLGKDLGDYFTQIGKAVPAALSSIDYSGLIDAIHRLLTTINAEFDTLDVTTPEGLARAIQFVIDTIASGIDTTVGMIEIYGRVKDVIVELIAVYNSLDIDQREAYGAALATADVMEKVGKVFGLLLTQVDSFSTIISSGLVRLSGLFTLVSNDVELLAALITLKFTYAAKDILELVDFVTLGMSETVGKALAYITDIHEGAKIAAIEASYDMEKGYNQLVRGLDAVGNEASNTKKFIDALAQSLDDTPREVDISVKADVDTSSIDEAIAYTAAEIERAHKQKSIDLEYQSSIKLDREAKDFIDFVSGTGAYAGKEIGVFTDSDLTYLQTRLANMRKELSTTTSALEDTTSVELKVPDDEKFKAAQAKLLKEIDTNADIMEAKIKGFSDIASAESESISSSFESIGDSITNTGDVLTELYRQMSTADTNIFAQQAIQRKISEEESRRKEAFDLQKELTLAQIDLIKQRSAAMASGDPMITVSGDGLQPHLEAFMWEILSAIQVRVNEDYGNFLLGIGAV